MATTSGEVKFIDVTLRDGNQSLWGAAGLNNEMIESMLPFEEKAGLKAVDLLASIHMGMSVRYFKENPWERIRIARRILKKTPFSFGTTGRRFIGFRWMPDSIMELVYKCMAANGMSRAWISEASHDIEVIHRNAAQAKKAGIDEFVVALCYTISPVHTDEYYAQKAREVVASPNVDTVYLKDQGGLLTPERIKTLIPTIRANIGNLNFEFHSHCSTALAPICYVDAVKMGVKVLHTAVPPLANSSSLPNIFNILKNIRYLGYEANVDEEALDAMSKMLAGFAEKQGREGGAIAEYDVSYYEHQLPGGMVSTMRRQLQEMKMEHRWGEIVEEVARVRKELGYPIMVTPLSQFVGTQSTMNVISGTRYKQVPEGVMQYAAGWFGKPTVPIDPNVLDKIASLPKAKQFFNQEFPQKSIEELRREIGAGPGVSDEEFLLRYSMSDKEVDEMLAASSGRAA
jgi:oxaloacetate decarboxylase alpha subunit